MRTAILAAALSLCATASLAQSNCTATPMVYELLATQFGESRVWIGQTDGDAMTEVWGNPETGSWSWLVTGQGITCLVSQGVGYSAGAAL